MLAKGIAEFQNALRTVVKDSSVATEPLLKSMGTRLKQFQAGADAVTTSMNVLEKAKQDMQTAGEELWQLTQSSDSCPKVQLALKARSGVLEPEIKCLEADIKQLEDTLADMKVRFDKESDIIAEVQRFIVDQNKKKKEWRDWHIQRWWSNRWESECDAYDRQADRNIAEQRQEGAFAEKTRKDVDLKMKECEQMIHERRQEKLRMESMLKEFPSILESTGVLSVEKRQADAKERFDEAHGVLKQAMTKVGVHDLKVASDVIMMYHQLTMLLDQSGQQAKHIDALLKQMVDIFDALLERIENNPNTENAAQQLATDLLILPKALQLIGEMYSARQRCFLDESTREQEIRLYRSKLSPQVSHPALSSATAQAAIPSCDL